MSFCSQARPLLVVHTAWSIWYTFCLWRSCVPFMFSWVICACVRLCAQGTVHYPFFLAGEVVARPVVSLSLSGHPRAASEELISEVRRLGADLSAKMEQQQQLSAKLEQQQQLLEQAVISHHRSSTCASCCICVPPCRCLLWCCCSRPLLLLPSFPS